MNFLLMPVGNDFPWYRFRTTISNVVYTIVMRYNSRMARWIMDINDASNNPIQVGIPILILRNLVGQYVTIGLPPGTFFCTDDTNTDEQATRNSFGTTHTLFYQDPDATNPYEET